MADTIRYWDEAFANLPDNSTGLISAQDVREMFLASESDWGTVIVSSVPEVEALVADVPFDALANAGTVQAGGILWDADGNNHLYPDWPGAITIPVDYQRFASATALVALSRDGSGPNSPIIFDIQVYVGGVAVGQPVILTAGRNESSIGTVTFSFLYKPADTQATNTVSFRVTCESSLTVTFTQLELAVEGFNPASSSQVAASSLHKVNP